MSPTTELVAGSVVSGDLINGVAIADPEEMGAPDVRVHSGEGPSAGGDFANEGVIIGFGGGTAAGCRGDRLEASGGEGGVKGDGIGLAWLEELGGDAGGGGIFRLHEDERHGVFGPIGFDEEWEGAVVAAEEGVGEESGFQVVKNGSEWGRPQVVWNGLAVELTGEVAEGSDANFEVSNEFAVEVEEAYKGLERLAGGWERPIADEIEFGRGGSVAVGTKIEADPFNALEEEVAFLGVEG